MLHLMSEVCVGEVKISEIEVWSGLQEGLPGALPAHFAELWAAESYKRDSCEK